MCMGAPPNDLQSDFAAATRMKAKSPSDLTPPAEAPSDRLVTGAGDAQDTLESWQECIDRLLAWLQDLSQGSVC